MKDSLFEILLNLFEKTLAQIKENLLSNPQALSEENDALCEVSAEMVADMETEVIKPAEENSLRIITSDEQNKLTKASYQFLMRLANLGVLTSELFEKVIHKLLFSESRYVGLQETKWVIRNTLSDALSNEQLAFLDLVLYQKENEFPLH